MNERSLRREDLATDPLAQFERWFAEAQADDLPEPTAMTLATADARGRPAARVVLLKEVDATGFVFYTNQQSRKGAELAENPWAALLFYWPASQATRQVRVEGPVARVSDAEADHYFGTRPRESQLGAWASPQSQVIADRAVLEARLEGVRQRFGEGAVARPTHWGGYRLRPEQVEFWQGRQHRLHDRFRYVRQGGAWRVERLAP